MRSVEGSKSNLMASTRPLVAEEKMSPARYTASAQIPTPAAAPAAAATAA
ncbi:MAG: hypothetical protein WKF95_02770 [Rubrobacter sp.]